MRLPEGSIEARGAGVGPRGLGYRRELGADLLRARHVVDFLEVVAESAWASNTAAREIGALAEMWPIVPHGVKLSLGSASGIDTARAAKLGELARRVRAPLVSEHVAMTSTPNRELGHLTAIPRTRVSVAAVVNNVARARRHLPDVPLLLENIATTFDWPEHTMSEPDFYAEVAERSGCDLLLDVANLYANAVNAGLDPVSVARAFPLDRVRMIHIAGGVFEDGFYFDTHADPVPDAVFAVLEAVLSAAPSASIVLERDAHFEPGLDPLVKELERASALRPSATRTTGSTAAERRAPAPLAVEAAELHALAERQESVAELLVGAASPSGALAEQIGETALLRTRKLLERKRVDDALPLLANLQARGAAVGHVAAHVVARLPRGPRRQGLTDAWLIAVASLAERALADDARRDRLLLRASFCFPDAAARARGAVPSPRLGPFVGFERLSSGATLWAVKGFGARVYLHTRQPSYPRLRSAELHDQRTDPDRTP
ncbi:MAG: DUF692 domain-containing protein [Polyangiaceae bacterium]